MAFGAKPRGGGGGGRGGRGGGPQRGGRGGGRGLYPIRNSKALPFVVHSSSIATA